MVVGAIDVVALVVALVVAIVVLFVVVLIVLLTGNAVVVTDIVELPLPCDEVELLPPCDCATVVVEVGVVLLLEAAHSATVIVSTIGK